MLYVLQRIRADIKVCYKYVENWWDKYPNFPQEILIHAYSKKKGTATSSYDGVPEAALTLFL